MKPKKKLISLIFIGFIGVVLLFFLLTRNNANGTKIKTDENQEIQFIKDYISFTKMAALPLSNLPDRTAWKKAAPDVVEISIPRSTGEADQPAFWYHSGTEKKKPLLLGLHSWSSNYLQQYGIPYGIFAQKNDWIFIGPDFRGAFNNEDATASEKAVQDVLDALDYAKEHAPVDEDRIYLVGFSGGAMMSLVMAGRYPEKFTAAVAWVPVYDLHDWYAYLVPSQLQYTIKYQADIEASCGGNPLADDTAKKECDKRSPSTYLENARDKGIRIFISGGLSDPFVPPSHAIRAYNDLVEEDQQISESVYEFIDENKMLPENLETHPNTNPFFEEAGLPVVFKRSSNGITLVLFDGGHDIVYNVGFEWLLKQKH
jgi:predicted esterase